jgi:hypothetical protein
VRVTDGALEQAALEVAASNPTRQDLKKSGWLSFQIQIVLIATLNGKFGDRQPPWRTTTLLQPKDRFSDIDRRTAALARLLVGALAAASVGELDLVIPNLGERDSVGLFKSAAS